MTTDVFADASLFLQKENNMALLWHLNAGGLLLVIGSASSRRLPGQHRKQAAFVFGSIFIPEGPLFSPASFVGSFSVTDPH